ncbi:MAG: rod shape-determining protein MreC [Fibrobacter sp.]|jgi:rod shape-determining protein MreC|nr:rod shape-determining protein MreC [Fibrobacter sp.]
MHWIVEFVAKHRSSCSFLVTIVLSLWMISGPPEFQARASRFLTITVFYPFQVTFNNLTHIRNIFSENRHLRLEVARLNTEVSRLQELKSENERLRGLLDLSQDFTYELLPVRVVARDPSIENKSVIINAGYKDGVRMWMPLVGENGVVGKVIQVMNGLSLVQLITDPSNRTSILNRRSRTVSILETENGRSFFFRCRNHEDVQIGDTIVTSGLGGIYPKGLRVGQVDRITDSQNPLFKRVWVELSVDFDRIEDLFVLLLSPQWQSFREELDSLELQR